MVTNLIIPVADTESCNFDYDGNLTRETYEDMVLDRFNRTNKQIDSFMHGNRMYNPYGVHDINEYEYSNMVHDNETEVEALLLDSDRDDFDENLFFDYLDTERMFVLIVNINPTTIDGDAESEIRYWMEDSSRVWEDDSLDNNTKLISSPSRTLKILLSDGKKYNLENCKIFEDYSDEKYPLYFAMIVEKITE